MRLPLFCTIIATSSLTAACGGASGPKTAQELGDRVLAALVAKDWNAMSTLYVTPDVIKSACAEMPAEKLTGMEKEFAEEKVEAEEKFKKCLEIDWTGAKITGVTGGEAGKPVEGCGDKVTQTKDVELAVEVGGKKYEVKVNDPALVSGGFALVEGIRCKAPELSCDDVFANMSKIITSAPEAKEDEKAMFNEEGKAQFGKMCTEMRDNPMFKSMLECVGVAKTYADMKACEDKVKAEMKAEPPPTPTAPPTEGAAPAPTGDVCAKYIANVTKCLEGVPPEVKEQVNKALDFMKQQTEGKPADQSAAMCNAALSSSKQALASLCPAVNWD